MPQRLRTRVGFPLRGISASFSRAIRRSVSSFDSSSAIAFSRAYLPAYFLTSFLRRSFLLIELSFAMDLSSLLSCSLSRLRERVGVRVFFFQPSTVVHTGEAVPSPNPLPRAGEG